MALIAALAESVTPQTLEPAPTAECGTLSCIIGDHQAPPGGSSQYPLLQINGQVLISGLGASQLGRAPAVLTNVQIVMIESAT